MLWAIWSSDCGHWIHAESPVKTRGYITRLRSHNKMCASKSPFPWGSSCLSRYPGQVEQELQLSSSSCRMDGSLSEVVHVGGTYKV